MLKIKCREDAPAWHFCASVSWWPCFQEASVVDNRHRHSYNVPVVSFSQGKDVKTWQKESWR
jgi:hypothetical protein